MPRALLLAAAVDPVRGAGQCQRRVPVERAPAQEDAILAGTPPAGRGGGGPPARQEGQRLSTLTTEKDLSTYTVTGVPSAFTMCAS